MGKSSRKKPLRLAGKLKRIREALDLSQDGMLIRLKLDDKTANRSRISNYELGVNEPPLNVLLAYSRTVNVYLDVLADDERDLPDELPSKKTSLGKKRKVTDN
jgi:transcriptional regulator with XRE-family HTH domain